MNRKKLLVLGMICGAVASADDTSRVWMSSPYLNHQTHQTIVGVLRDAGYSVRDYTPQEVDRTAPRPVAFVVVKRDDGRFYELSIAGLPRDPYVARGKDNFLRRNGVVNGYDYRSAAVRTDPKRLFDDLKRRFSYDMDIRTERSGAIVSVPALQGYTLDDVHTFASVPQNDESTVLNHLYRSVLTASEKQKMRVTVHYDVVRERIWFRSEP